MSAPSGQSGPEDATASAGRTAACVRVAAVGDVHIGALGEPPSFDGIAEAADLLLLAGDLTRTGERAEVERLAVCLGSLDLPVVAVLGNHDHHAGRPETVVEVLRSAGVTVLEQSSCVLDLGGRRIGVAGAKGFGGGMPGAAATSFGEPEMKAFVAHGEQVATGLSRALAELVDEAVDLRLVVLHYSPVAETLEGEPPEIHAFLGDYRLAEAVDTHGADLVVHGHAHLGRERGRTPGGVPVRNVAKPVIRAPYRVFELPVRAPAAATSSTR